MADGGGTYWTSIVELKPKKGQDPVLEYLEILSSRLNYLAVLHEYDDEDTNQCNQHPFDHTHLIWREDGKMGWESTRIGATLRRQRPKFGKDWILKGQKVNKLASLLAYMHVGNRKLIDQISNDEKLVTEFHSIDEDYIENMTNKYVAK